MIYSNFLFAKINLVTTTTDLAAIVIAIGKNNVEVMSIAKGTQDPHQVSAKPSFMIKLRDAQLVIAQGLELEDAWIIPLIDGSRNPKIKKGTSGYLELGSLLNPIDVASTQVSRSNGDVHPNGNPHFQLDPIRLGQAAIIIGERLGQIDPNLKDFYQQNAKKFQEEMSVKWNEWKKRLVATGIKEIITYHKTLNYFCTSFGIICQLQLEPKPGIPPTISHSLELIKQIKDKKIHLVLIENYFDRDSAGKIKESIPDMRISPVPVSVGGEAEISDNFILIEKIVQLFEMKK